MTTEAKKSFKRIISNYARLLSALVLGIILLPIFIDWLGFEALGLVSLVGASVGFAHLFSILTEQSLIRELSAAYHSKDESLFPRFYHSAYVVSTLFATLTGIVFLGLFIFIGYLKIPPDLVWPGRWMILCQGIWACLYVFLSPAYSMFQVREQFGWHNFCQVANRATILTSVLILAYGFHITDVPKALTLHGIVWSGLLCLIIITAVALVIIDDRRLIPNIRLIRRDAVRQLLGTFGWNSGVHIAMGLYERLAALLMNLAFGLHGNAVFEIGHRMSAYVRMTTAGVTLGLESVSARVSSNEESKHAIRNLLHHSSRLQAFVALPAGLTVFVLARPLLDLWISGSAENAAEVIPLAVVIVQILAFAITSRSITDGWIFILYGVGHVRRYAPLIFAGGVMSPIVGALLLWLLPDHIRINAPAIGYAVVFTTVHLILLPIIASRCLHMKYGDFFTPLLRPAFATALCSPLLIAPSLWVEHWTLLKFAAVALAFGGFYTIVSWIGVLTPEERKRFTNALRRSLTPRNA